MIIHRYDQGGSVTIRGTINDYGKAINRGGFHFYRKSVIGTVSYSPRSRFTITRHILDCWLTVFHSGKNYITGTSLIQNKYIFALL